jgi:hypothetical protein
LDLSRFPPYALGDLGQDLFSLGVLRVRWGLGAKQHVGNVPVNHHLLGRTFPAFVGRLVVGNLPPGQRNVVTPPLQIFQNPRQRTGFCFPSLLAIKLFAPLPVPIHPQGNGDVGFD